MSQPTRNDTGDKTMQLPAKLLDRFDLQAEAPTVQEAPAPTMAGCDQCRDEYGPGICPACAGEGGPNYNCATCGGFGACPGCCAKVPSPAEQAQFTLEMCESMGVPFEQAHVQMMEDLKSQREDPVWRAGWAARRKSEGRQ